ncbi:ABC transporter permease [Kamptonema sp. UHCC 0994]|uniref:ABC transporter permease n=1 Tax=Kamptonema sp. UHCC 0994 TaxID=3031329 RepID=UPI0023B93E0C|nr:ABC transporter permease [Kamptonema sp. UHCC 0994]MDF0552958.1 ABC transporter permease [Kamptonema sp. UHCC 0994]
MLITISNIIAIYRKELQSYFASPLAYAIAAIFWFVTGLFLVAILLSPDGLIPQVARLDQQGISETIDVPYEFLQAFLGLMGSISLFILPMLSMGLYAEERKRGTLELLATSPLTNWAVAVGKLLGVLTFYTTMLIPLIACELIALSASSPPLPPAVFLLGHAGLILLAASVLSLGMFISSLTESTILSAILTFALVLFLWIIKVASSSISGPVGKAIGHLSLLTHYTNLVKGIVDTSSLAMFATYIFLGVFLTAQFIDVLRFQRS